MKRSVCCIILIVLLNAGLHAQNYLFLGAGGGAFSNLPSDINLRAVASTVHADYHKYTFAQYDYLGVIAPVVSMIFGYSTKHFGLQLGIDALFNINENIEARHPATGELTARVSYTYTAFNIPLILHFFPVSKPKFKFGFFAGAYFAIPFEGVQKDATAPANFFDKTGAAINRITTLSTVDQDFASGVRFGLIIESSLGKGVFVFEIGYQRELFPVASSMNIEATLNNGIALVEYSERKLTILSGPRIGLAYKHKIKTWNRASPPQEQDLSQQPANTDASKSNSYFIMVADDYEGPLQLPDLKTRADQGLITAETMLWKKGVANWAKAETFEELEPLFNPPQ